MRDYLVKLFGEKIGFRWVWFNVSAVTLSALCWGLAYLHGKLSLTSHYLWLLIAAAIGAFIISGFMKTESLRAKGFKIAYATILFPGFVITLAFASVMGGLVFINSSIYNASRIASKFITKQVYALFGKEMPEEKVSDIVVVQNAPYRNNAGESVSCDKCGSEAFVQKDT
jgi:hypothetical protein